MKRIDPGNAFSPYLDCKVNGRILGIIQNSYSQRKSLLVNGDYTIYLEDLLKDKRLISLLSIPATLLNKASKPDFSFSVTLTMKDGLLKDGQISATIDRSETSHYRGTVDDLRISQAEVHFVRRILKYITEKNPIKLAIKMESNEELHEHPSELDTQREANAKLQENQIASSEEEINEALLNLSAWCDGETELGVDFYIPDVLLWTSDAAQYMTEDQILRVMLRIRDSENDLTTWGLLAANTIPYLLENIVSHTPAIEEEISRIEKIARDCPNYWKYSFTYNPVDKILAYIAMWRETAK